ncbi:hypothetical protein OENI_10261 [Oenococcus oeni]|nr:hypothetical protein OENI_10261 [Oenococcus oeni]
MLLCSPFCFYGRRIDLITLKSDREIRGMLESGAILAGMHKAVSEVIKPGISSCEIEKVGRKYIESHGAIPAELGFEEYKYATCVSINDESRPCNSAQESLFKGRGHCENRHGC